MTGELLPLTNEEWIATIEHLCDSKADEFRLIGYEHVSGNDIWQCVKDRYTKTGEPAMHQVVNDILSLKVTKFMNFLTVSAYKGTHF
ncbi:post-transcriptional regulator [Paenibacillus sp. BC26]|uniref:post-transcriptional regulator n=1 Tax=Paenibacillus sp. BC26 TaxID=1881032 RepID=UPI0008EB9E3E|nr:post-transcriptional regulator [Paenibacillus sp. BC26]SFS58834.1 Post-transcriptional regulator [Paenibacillus sp. BC26]